MKMKSTTLRLIVLFALAFTGSALSAHEKNAAGPNGGRLITAIEPHAEFLVTPERKVRVTFVGEDGQPVAPAGQTVTVTAGDRAAPATLTFTKTAEGLLSDGALPEGNDYPTVVVIKPTPDAKPVIARFNLNTTICGGCDRPEYACTCGH